MEAVPHVLVFLTLSSVVNDMTLYDLSTKPCNIQPKMMGRILHDQISGCKGLDSQIVGDAQVGCIQAS